MRRLMFAMRLRYGLRWRRPHWLPAAHEVAMGLVTALVVLIIYLATAKVAIEDARAEAHTAKEQAEQQLLDCLNGRLYLIGEHEAVKCMLGDTIRINRG